VATSTQAPVAHDLQPDVEIRSSPADPSHAWHKFQPERVGFSSGAAATLPGPMLATAPVPATVRPLDERAAALESGGAAVRVGIFGALAVVLLAAGAVA
jgi:hypothetical protein